MLHLVPVHLLKPKAISFEDFFLDNPLNFQIYYTNERGVADVYDTIYLEDGNSIPDVYLEIFNESEQFVSLLRPDAPSDHAGPLQCHFAIRFEKELQLNPDKITVAGNDWIANYWDSDDEHFFTVYFLHKNGFAFTEKGGSNDRIKITLEGLVARNSLVKTSNFELLYGNNSELTVNGKVPFTETIKVPVTCRKAITITNSPNKNAIPLHYRFIGPNTILNDSITSNSLVLQLVNHPPTNARPILELGKESKFILTFETGGNPTDLTNINAVNQIRIEPQNNDKRWWKLERTQNVAKWELSFNPDQSALSYHLQPGPIVTLKISSLVTGNASGVSYLSIAYLNIPNYPDGQLLVPIEKTPLLYRGGRVGIGTAEPSEKLHVHGDFVLGQNYENRRFIFHSRMTANCDKLYITSDSTGGSWEWDKGIVLSRDGLKVGIGTENPTQKLEVQGGDIKLSSENSGIVFSNNSRIYHFNGGVKFKAMQNGPTKGFEFLSPTGNPVLNIASDRLMIGMDSNDKFASEILNVVGNIRMLPDKNNKPTGIVWGDVSRGDGTGGLYYKSEKGHNAALVKLAEVGDLTLGADRSVSFRIFDTERMKVNQVGVGIGNPSDGIIKQALHVNGDYYGRGHIYLYAFEGEFANGVAYIQARNSINNLNETKNSIALQLRTQIEGRCNDVMRLTHDGLVGIGTTSPTRAKVHIEGHAGYHTNTVAYLFYSGSQSYGTASSPQYYAAYSLYADSNIMARELHAYSTSSASDARIKDIQGRSDRSSDLQTLLQIEITDFLYKDKVSCGDRRQKKVIGQQIAGVFPQSVKKNTDVIPDIYQLAQIAKGWVQLPDHGLQTGERVQLLTEKGERQIYTIEAVTPDRFQVPATVEGEVFVYGREVDDFHIVDYDALSMLHISATQELWHMINALKIDLQQLKAQLNGSHHPAVAVAPSLSHSETP